MSGAGRVDRRALIAGRHRRVSAELALLDLLHVEGGSIPLLTDANWDRVVALAVREQVCPCVLASVRTRPGAEVPASARITLERMCSRTEAYGVIAHDQLSVLIRSLRAAGIAAVPIKGVALARFMYADGSLRPFNDLDLLISHRHRAAADRVLREAGYVTIPTAARALEDHGAQVYWDPSWRRLPVDVHWRFDAAPVWFGLDYEGMLRRAQVEMIETEPVHVLSPADMLVALSAHFVKHLWWGQPRLRYLRDIAEVTHRFRVDWGRVVDTAVEAPMIRSPLRVTLSTAARLTGALVPVEVISNLAPSRGLYVDRCLLALTRRRILRRQDWPFKPFVQIAAMRWLDGDTWDVYPKLAAWVVGSRWRRLAGGAMSVVGRVTFAAHRRRLSELPIHRRDIQDVEN